jgi:hypothetical protein
VFICGCFPSFAALAHNFKEDDSGGDGDVEGAHRAGGGNRNQEIAAFAD